MKDFEKAPALMLALMWALLLGALTFSSCTVIEHMINDEISPHSDDSTWCECNGFTEWVSSEDCDHMECDYDDC